MKKRVTFVTGSIFLGLFFFGLNFILSTSNAADKIWENAQIIMKTRALEEERLLEEAKILEKAKIIEEVRLLEEARLLEVARILEEERKKRHIKAPENIKSLYFSAHSAWSKDKLDNFFEIAKAKEINSIMIDLKEVDWYTSFELDESFFWKIKPTVSRNNIKNISELIKRCHENGIYVIARIVVFKDKRLAEVRPDLAVKWISDWSVWTDYKWYKYVDQYSKEVWDYNANLWIAAYELGFDEINYDYVRFPTDWYISKASYPFANEIILKDIKWGKVKVIDMFSNYITTKIREHNPKIVISADVFWLVTDGTMFGIGQNLESFLLAFDFVWPMVYPSHYWEWYYGYKFPDNVPYNIVNIALNNASEKIKNLNLEISNAKIEFRDIKLNDSFIYDKRILNTDEISLKKIRPYLQWFSCTRCRNYSLYNREKFRTLVNAVNDIWLDSWWVRSSWSNYHNERFDVDDIKIVWENDENL